MFRYFTSRQLGAGLGVNLARWKRWSREFLPPDSLGGFQSGYTRQFHPDDAFRVFVGGHLVSRLHVNIPEAKIILDDLEAWLESNRFTFAPQPAVDDSDGRDIWIERFEIQIFPVRDQDPAGAAFVYRIRGLIDEQWVRYRGVAVRQERYTQYGLPASAVFPDPDADSPHKVLHITALLRRFVTGLALPPSHYGTLNPSAHLQKPVR